MIRGLTRRECCNLIRRYQHEPALLELEACRLSVLEPESYDWENNLAGIITNLFSKVWDVSGADANGQYLTAYAQEATDWLMDTQGKQEAISLACVPGLTLELLHNADPPDYIKYLWLGQFACEAIFGIPIDRLLTPPPPPPEQMNQRPPNSPPPQRQPSPPRQKSVEVEDYADLINQLPPHMFKPPQ